MKTGAFNQYSLYMIFRAFMVLFDENIEIFDVARENHASVLFTIYRCNGSLTLIAAVIAWELFRSLRTEHWHDFLASGHIVVPLGKFRRSMLAAVLDYLRTYSGVGTEAHQDAFEIVRYLMRFRTSNSFKKKSIRVFFHPSHSKTE